MLEVKGLTAGYGRQTILHGVDLAISPGEMVGLFGRNGAGKTTLTQAILGAVRTTGGEVRWQDRVITKLQTDRIVNLGVSLVPQSRGLFMSLTVHENLVLSCLSGPVKRTEVKEREEEMYERFPALAGRRDVPAASLSGGEQQMLALAKALMRRPAMLIVDEPSTGLAPKVLEDIATLLADLRSDDFSFLITEQNLHWALGMVDRAYVMEQGRIVDELEATAASRDVDAVLARYLGAAA
jgi:branched-chain amino acid transport system ATP-binding protein